MIRCRMALASLAKQKRANKAYIARWGFCVIFKHFAYAWLRVFSAPRHCPRPPQRQYPAKSVRDLRKPLARTLRYSQKTKFLYQAKLRVSKVNLS